MPTFAIFSTLYSLLLQFEPPRLGQDFPWNEPTLTCRAFLDGYCSTVQGLLDWFEVDLRFTCRAFHVF